MQLLYEIKAGDKSIYSDPGVIKGVTNPGALEKPVFKDDRGEIHRLQFAGVKTNMIVTKAGFMRSGDLHPNTQFDQILSGLVELRTLENGITVKKVLRPNTFVVIGPNVPHLFHFLEDTVMMEWWDGPFEAWYYRPYRDIIDAETKRVRGK